MNMLNAPLAEKSRPSSTMSTRLEKKRIEDPTTGQSYTAHALGEALDMDGRLQQPKTYCARRHKPANGIVKLLEGSHKDGSVYQEVVDMNGTVLFILLKPEVLARIVLRCVGGCLEDCGNIRAAAVSSIKIARKRSGQVEWDV